MAFSYKYPRPAITVDIIVMDSAVQKILLIKRLNDPFKDQWALPGGFLDMDELLIDAAKRELFEETALQNIDLKQFIIADAINRDPRHRTISVIYYGIYNNAEKSVAGDDAKELKWFPISNLPDVAFDHTEIIERFISEKVK